MGQQLPPSKPPLYCAAELQDQEFPPAVATIPGILYGGHALLAGKPKRRKSWLAMQFAIAIASGTDVLGRKCRQGDVLYLALEDTPRRLQSRMGQLMAEEASWPEGLYFVTDWPRMSEGGIQLMHDWLQGHPKTRLIIVDTLPKIRDPQRTEFSYQGDYQVAGAVKTVADAYGVTILSVVHLRKMQADDPLEQISGTTGLTASVDGIMVLDVNSARTKATLHVTGKDVEEEQDLSLKRDTGASQWYVDPSAEIQHRHERQQIYDIVAQSKFAPTIREIWEALQAQDIDVDKSTVRKRVQRMEDDGVIARYSGHARSGYTYILTPKAQPSIPMSDFMRDIMTSEKLAF